MNFYDCCTYNNEELILDIRLNHLNKFVKKFIIVESRFTHQGKEKIKFFDIKNFKKFENKIQYYLIDKFPDNLSNWGRENFQRNFHANVIQDLHDDDYVMISDLDEIPNMRNIKDIDKFKYTVFEQLNFSYKFNLINKTHLNWYGTRLCKKKNLKAPQWLRDQKVKKYSIFKFYKIKWNIIKKGGWHFSYLMSSENIREKIKSFSHAEFNLDKYTNINIIDEKIKKGVDLFGRDQKYQKVELDKSFPKMIFDNKKHLSDWII